MNFALISIFSEIFET